MVQTWAKVPTSQWTAGLTALKPEPHEPSCSSEALMRETSTPQEGSEVMDISSQKTMGPLGSSLFGNDLSNNPSPGNAQRDGDFSARQQCYKATRHNLILQRQIFS